MHLGAVGLTSNEGKQMNNSHGVEYELLPPRATVDKISQWIYIHAIMFKFPSILLYMIIFFLNVNPKRPCSSCCYSLFHEPRSFMCD